MRTDRLDAAYVRVMYPPPVGKDLTAEQARELDDTFLASDPCEYFRARIAGLLSWAETAPRGAPNEDRPDVTTDPSSLRAQFNTYLQRPAADTHFKDVNVDAQIAADALAVRHHAAEALVRLACARLAPDTTNGVACLWAAIADGPVQIGDVISRLSQSASEPDPVGRFIGIVLPPEQRERAQERPEVVQGVNVFLDWLNYAMALLSPAPIDLHSAHNKVKHGLAVRSRADMRVEFITGPLPAPEAIPVSVFNSDAVITIFDKPVLELLAHGPRVNGHRQGLEVTQLRLNSAALLADTFMIATTHGAMFHVAAVEHFAGRDDLPDHIEQSAFPGLPGAGPKPEHIDADAPLGMRFPLTTPPGGGQPARKAGLGFRDYFQYLEVDYDGRMQGTVVDG